MKTIYDVIVIGGSAGGGYGSGSVPSLTDILKQIRLGQAQTFILTATSLQLKIHL